jgi:hypothetical protein
MASVSLLRLTPAGVTIRFKYRLRFLQAPFGLQYELKAVEGTPILRPLFCGSFLPASEGGIVALDRGRADGRRSLVEARAGRRASPGRPTCGRCPHSGKPFAAC